MVILNKHKLFVQRCRGCNQEGSRLMKVGQFISARDRANILAYEMANNGQRRHPNMGASVVVRAAREGVDYEVMNNEISFRNSGTEAAVKMMLGEAVHQLA